MMLDEMVWLGVWQDNDMYSVSTGWKASASPV